jgi:hypothetical protein
MDATKQDKIKKVLVWVVSMVISAFFIVSGMGWFAATDMMNKGLLGKEVTEFNRSLTVIDHIIRTAQIVIVVAASISLILLRRLANYLFLICLIISLIAFLFGTRWQISFLPPIILLPICVYTYLINRYGFLRGMQGSEMVNDDEVHKPHSLLGIISVGIAAANIGIFAYISYRITTYFISRPELLKNPMLVNGMQIEQSTYNLFLIFFMFQVIGLLLGICGLFDSKAKRLLPVLGASLNAIFVWFSVSKLGII